MTALLMTNKEAAEYLRLSPGTLDNLRCTGDGPKYYQRKARGRVFYDRADLDAWRAGQKKESTSNS